MAPEHLTSGREHRDLVISSVWLAIRQLMLQEKTPRLGEAAQDTSGSGLQVLGRGRRHHSPSSWALRHRVTRTQRSSRLVSSRGAVSLKRRISAAMRG